jgi:hypothetical protein
MITTESVTGEGYLSVAGGRQSFVVSGLLPDNKNAERERPAFLK